MAVQTVRIRKRACIHPVPLRVVTDGNGIAKGSKRMTQRCWREGVALLRSCGIILGLAVMLVLYLSGFAQLNVATNRKVRLEHALRGEQIRYIKLRSRLEESRASERIARWAMQAGMVRRKLSQTVTLPEQAASLASARQEPAGRMAKSLAFRP